MSFFVTSLRAGKLFKKEVDRNEEYLETLSFLARFNCARRFTIWFCSVGRYWRQSFTIFGSKRLNWACILLTLFDLRWVHQTLELYEIHTWDWISHLWGLVEYPKWQYLWAGRVSQAYVSLRRSNQAWAVLPDSLAPSETTWNLNQSYWVPSLLEFDIQSPDLRCHAVGFLNQLIYHRNKQARKLLVVCYVTRCDSGDSRGLEQHVVRIW